MSHAKFSPSTRGIYPENVYAETPSDAVDIPDNLYQDYLNGNISAFTVIGGEVVQFMAPTVDPRENMKVTTFQAHAAINRSGLYNAVTELMNDPATDFEVKLAWDKAQHFSRLSPAVLAMGAALGLTDQQLDDLFALAATIEA